jgi:hypothetical protein
MKEKKIHIRRKYINQAVRPSKEEKKKGKDMSMED